MEITKGPMAEDVEASLVVEVEAMQKVSTKAVMEKQKRDAASVERIIMKQKIVVFDVGDASSQLIQIVIAEGFDSKIYISLIGSLIFLIHTRTDIVHSVSLLSRFMSNPSRTHFTATKRVLHYLKGIQNVGLKYTKDQKDDLVGYVDSDWARSLDDHRSTSGYLFCIGTKPISWSSKKQSTVALSSAEAEYIAANEATREAVWHRRLLLELQQKVDESTTIFCDNQSAIAMTKNPVFHARSKHIELRHHFIREIVSQKEILLEFISTHDKPTDVLIKAEGYEEVPEGISLPEGDNTSVEGVINPTEDEQKAYKENVMKNAMALRILQQSVSKTIYLRIFSVKKVNEAWEVLKKEFKGSHKVFSIKLHNLCNDFDNLSMKDAENVKGYFLRIVEILNQLKSCREAVPDRKVVKKILRSLPQKFDHVATMIKEMKNLAEVFIYELMDSLEAHEKRFSSLSSVFLALCRSDARLRIPKVMQRGEGSEAEVTWEDQLSINKFSNLNNRLHELEDEIKAAKEANENLEDAGNELILTDEDIVRFQIGEVFAHVPRDEVETRIEQMKEVTTKNLEKLEEEKESVVAQMAELKVVLYAKFKDSINLEED
ncbi:hypothetical protein MLD38_023679 [Melastoma candidum]|uniref:Uncharacterized protein n=1 Tax=Melastoma candidum TaxID=119954 RepID=A0ACB9NRJ0_9MYRT|nr:hypothetical protein MLD38_023679 [Melastoma candidum]